MDWKRTSEELPPSKEGWNFSERVLVYYAATENYLEDYGVAYYNRKPPFENEPEWIDWSGRGRGRIPLLWCAIVPPGPISKLLPLAITTVKYVEDNER